MKKCLKNNQYTALNRPKFERIHGTLSKLFNVFKNSLLFDKAIVFLCMFKKTSKINQILWTKS